MKRGYLQVLSYIHGHASALQLAEYCGNDAPRSSGRDHSGELVISRLSGLAPFDHPTETSQSRTQLSSFLLYRINSVKSMNNVENSQNKQAYNNLSSSQAENHGERKLLLRMWVKIQWRTTYNINKEKYSDKKRKVTFL